MKLKFKRFHRGCYNDEYEKGKIIEYHPWDFEWQGMTEPERVKKGIFVHCYGMGEFDAFKKEDVEPIK